MRFAARLSGHGRAIEVFTTEPGLQIYTGNWIPDGFAAKGEDKLCERCGIALETGHYPDSPNKPAFPDTVLRPGQKLESRTEFRFIAE
jgi:aldose 1-epimerase